MTAVRIRFDGLEAWLRTDGRWTVRPISPKAGTRTHWRAAEMERWLNCEYEPGEVTFDGYTSDYNARLARQMAERLDASIEEVRKTDTHEDGVVYTGG